MAIRGMVEPGEGAVVIGFKDGVAIARDRITGRTFKFSIAAAELGDPVSADIAKVGMANARACCKIVAINGNLVTVSEPAVGRTFQLKFAAQPPGLSVGQAVNANFKLGTATIAGNALPITNLSQCAGLRP